MSILPLRAGVVGLLLLSACFSEHTGPSTGGSGVAVGDIFFRSNRNGTANPAIDTIAVGDSLTWRWGATGATPHSVESEGAPAFVSSAVLTGSGTVYTVTFTAPGSFDYDCAVHGSGMSGTVVVR